jgi:hypothetical protein
LSVGRSDTTTYTQSGDHSELLRAVLPMLLTMITSTI